MEALWYGILAAILNMLFSSISNVIYKSQGKQIKPTAMLFIQVAVAGISFVLITAIMGDFMDLFRIKWSAYLAFVFAAVSGIIIGNFMYLTSLQLIGVSISYPIAMSYPLLTYIFEILFLDGEFIWVKLIGIILVIAGIIIITFSLVRNGDRNNEKQINIEEDNSSEIVDYSEVIVVNSPEASIAESTKKNQNFKDKLYDSKVITFFRNNSMFFGILLAILTSVTWASGTTLIKYALNNTDVEIIPVNAARLFVLIPVAFVIYMFNDGRKKKSNFSWKSVLLVVLGALFGLVAANIFYLQALDNVGTSTAAAIAAAGPMVTTPLSVIFLKEKVNWLVVIGTLCTIGGILLIIFLG
ncbi:MAG: DMT family transporter [Asgard group archaeon]|nr:DMT family transporter [Asgard group archaeon]